MTKNILFLAAILLISVACKKKKETTAPEPEPEIVNVVSAKVNDVEKTCSSACYSGSTSGGLRGVYFYFNGFSEYIYFSCGTLPTPGVYTLVKYGNPYLMYSKDNSNRPAAAGTINITAIDTSSRGVINNLTATFSFKTDTSSSGTSYNVTNGAFNLKN